ncbi:hypothetical protein SAMN05443144_1361 [Fodinibius roseus]|uniref:Uncharacterized protein n=1 Tax=Fodinibius roseus TaxID=1194090 RepID=A0A1M5KYL5_9BACT|nr:hypothetical protein SAMN05443144_1361 [Fodinibius roseus]
MILTQLTKCKVKALKNPSLFFDLFFAAEYGAIFLVVGNFFSVWVLSGLTGVPKRPAEAVIMCFW